MRMRTGPSRVSQSYVAPTPRVRSDVKRMERRSTCQRACPPMSATNGHTERGGASITRETRTRAMWAVQHGCQFRDRMSASDRPGGLMKVSMTVNGSSTEHDVEPRLLLVQYLRDV